ncbi:MAG: cytochrome c [Kofleriaceae bacterium]|nr:cytochrome c [Kofleriaceae bacterium]
MHISTTSLLGIVFLGLSFAATFLMFHLWGYEYDEVNKKSSAPQWKMNIHRGIGFAYVAIYIIMMTEMVPRLWEYQVEFPARTVVHVVLGTVIGVVLLIKVSIIRFFRHLEEWMPALGVSLLMCTVLLAVMSLPAFYREKALADGAVGGSVYSVENRTRVARLLPEAGLPEDANIEELASEKSLEEGRQVLLGKCIACHDLKTVIAKARTPSDWVRTSKRMALKPSLAAVISLEESYQAATYLIAITPSLQQSAKSKRANDKERGVSQEAVEAVLVADETPDAAPEVMMDAGVPEAVEAIEDKKNSKVKKPKKPKKPRKDKTAPVVSAGTPTETTPPKVVEKPKPKYDAAKAKELFNDECSLCHGIGDVDDAPPTSRDEVNSVLRRMVGNGLDLEKEDLSLIRKYMLRRYVKK